MLTSRQAVQGELEFRSGTGQQLSGAGVEPQFYSMSPCDGATQECIEHAPQAQGLEALQCSRAL
jgi:hypothetical protein